MKIFEPSPLKYGLLMCAVTTVCLLLMEFTGQNQSFDMKSPFQAFFLIIAPFVIWYLGIKAKKNEQKGKLSFREGWGEGIKISIVYAVFSPFLFLFYYLLINPGIIPWMKDMYGMSASSDALIIALDMTVQFVSAIIFGTVYAAVISFFLKTRS